jgi:hypothetical protein
VCTASEMCDSCSLYLSREPSTHSNRKDVQCISLFAIAVHMLWLLIHWLLIIDTLY